MSLVPLTIGQAVQQGTAILSKAGVDAPGRNAELLLAHALAKPRTHLLARPEEQLTELAWIHYGRWLHERSQGKPLQYILKTEEFYGRPFRVTPDVLIPRPETEMLAERAIQLRPKRMADIGTGSGALAITVQLETGCQCFAGDLSMKALHVARQNAQALHSQIAFFQGDLTTCLAPESVDVITANLPYVPLVDAPDLQREVKDWEPAMALFAGQDGLDLFRRFLPWAAQTLRTGGTVLGEFGFGQSEKILALAEPHFSEAWVENDLAGIPRMLVAKRGTGASA